MIDRPRTADSRRPATLRAGVDRAVVQARREVIERHRRLDVPLAIWRDGAVAIVSPHEVPLPELPAIDEAGAPEEARP